MKKPKWTPGPWKVLGASIVYSPGHRFICKSVTGDNSASLRDPRPGDPEFEQSYQDLYYIVRAVNSHEALVRALKEAKSCIQDLGSGEGGWAWEEVLDDIQATLDLADGKEETP